MQSLVAKLQKLVYLHYKTVITFPIPAMSLWLWIKWFTVAGSTMQDGPDPSLIRLGREMPVRETPSYCVRETPWLGDCVFRGCRVLDDSMFRRLCV